MIRVALAAVLTLLPGFQSGAHASRVIGKTAGKTVPFSPAAAPVLSIAAPSLGSLNAPTLQTTLPEVLPVLTLPKAESLAQAAAPTAKTISSAIVMPTAKKEKAPIRSSLSKTAQHFTKAEKQGGGKSAAVARRTFDAAGKTGTATEAVDLSGISSIGSTRSNLAPARELGNNASPLITVYEAARWAGRSKMPEGSPQVPKSKKTRLYEALETGITGGLVSLFAGLSITASNFLEIPAALPLLLAVGALSAYHGMREHLGSMRDITMYTVQHSHDIRYRVNTSQGGRLTDVRGGNKRYGDDRYRKAIPGPVGRNAHLLMRLFAASAPAFWLMASGASFEAYAIYNLAALGLFALSDLAVARSDREWKNFVSPGAHPPLRR